MRLLNYNDFEIFSKNCNVNDATIHKPLNPMLINQMNQFPSMKSSFEEFSADVLGKRSKVCDVYTGDQMKTKYSNAFPFHQCDFFAFLPNLTHKNRGKTETQFADFELFAVKCDGSRFKTM